MTSQHGTTLQRTAFLSGVDVLAGCERFYRSKSVKAIPGVPAEVAAAAFCEYVASAWSAQV